jgi:hypothetical protein
MSLGEACAEPATFQEAIKAVGPTPCQNCPMYDSCASRDLACLAFQQFVSGSERSVWAHTLMAQALPTRRIYASVFTGKHSLKPANRPGRPSELLRRSTR